MGKTGTHIGGRLQIQLTQKKVDAYRRRAWPQGELQSLDQMAAFLQRAGLVLIFGSREVPLPKIYYCADDAADWWAWKDLLQAKKLAYSARIVRHKATLVSMELLPACLSLYLHGGGYLVYEEEYYWGKLSELANRAAQYLERHGPTPVDQLRKAVIPSGKENTRRFHAALYELQTKYKTVSVGLVEKGWGVRILGLFVDWVPRKIEQAAERMTKEKALEVVAERFVKTAGAIPEKMLPRIFGWSMEDASPAIETLVKAGKFERGQLRGRKESWLIHPALPQDAEPD